MFTLSTLVTIVVGTRRKNRYHPQGGTVRAAFGGSNPSNDAFGGLIGTTQKIVKPIPATLTKRVVPTPGPINRPAVVPGIAVKQYPLKPIQKEIKKFPF